MLRTTLFLLVGLLALRVSAQDLQTNGDRNRVIVRTPRVATDNPFQGEDQVETTVQYTDGMGRVQQSIHYRRSPQRRAIVEATSYDNLGRPERSYLPYRADAQNAALRGDPHFEAQNFWGDGAPFSRNVYDGAGRPRQQFGPGQAWQTNNRLTTTDFEVADGVRRWKQEGNRFKGYDSYPGNSITRKRLTDEDNRQVLEYTNRDGNVVLREVQGPGGSWLRTGYVYDDLGRLIGIVPPKLWNNIDFDINEQAELVYAFRYDDQGRMIEKLTPGGGWTHLVYNRLGQVVMSRNARHQNEQKWLFTKYDGNGRTLLTGWFGNNESRQTWQDRLDNESGDVFEVRAGDVLGYSNRCQPFIGEGNVMVVNYYDDYNNRPGDLGNDGPNVYGNTRGLLTVTKVRNLFTNGWLETAQYYDDRGRIVEIQSRNRFGNKNSTYNSYNFAGDLTQERVVYRKSGSSDLDVRTRYDYDHAGRKTKAYHSINGQEFTLAEYDYDEIGRLIKKRIQPGNYQAGGGGGGNNFPANITQNTETVGSYTATQEILLNPNFQVIQGNNYDALIGTNSGGGGGNTNALQTIDYTYNIRGGLWKVNNNGLNSGENDLFGMELKFHEDNRYWSGYLSKQEWISKTRNTTRSYTYTYDEADRLTNASYSGGNGGFPGENYSIDGIGYDPNGNITSLDRNGMTGGSNQNPTGFGRIDQLRYNYHNGGNSNRLQWVTDEVGQGNADVGDFRDRNGGTNDYDYYADGSVSADRNRQIESIQYNFLGLPEYIQLSGGRSIRHVYDGTGQKLYKLINQPGQGEKRIDYVGDVIYKDGQVFTVHTDEGRAIPQSGNPSNFIYEYHYRDHQGNLRVAYRQQNQPQTVLRLSFEPELAGNEEPLQPDVPTVRNTQASRAGRHSAKVWGGPALSHDVAVEPGETITVRVFAHYPVKEEKKKRRFFLPLPWLERTGRNVPGNEQATGGGNRWTVKGGIFVPIGRDGSSRAERTETPEGYLKLAVLDSAGNAVQTLTAPVTAEARNGWQELALELKVVQKGTIRTWVGSDTNAPIWFDDYTITDQPPVIVQENHYDPWGLNLTGIEVVGSPEDPFQFQGKEREETFGLTLDDFGWRLYDPQLGRWHATDPEDQFASPYTALANSPVEYVDKDGRIAFLAAVGIGAAISALTYTAKVATSPGGFQNWSWKNFAFSTLQGAVSGAVSFGVGELFKNAALWGVSPFEIGLSRGLAHGVSQAAVGAAFGGNPSQSFLSGFVSSGISSFAAPLGDLGQLAAGGLSGGISNAIAGGDFWQGLGQGLVVAGLNHLAHNIVEPPRKGNGVPKPLTAKERQMLKKQILADNELTWNEANEWFRHGRGEHLIVDADKVSLGSVSSGDFPGGIGTSKNIQTLFMRNGRTYGQLTVTLLKGNRIRIEPDFYNFEMHSWKTPSNWFRNFATISGQSHAGVYGTPYSIYFRGSLPLPRR